MKPHLLSSSLALVSLLSPVALSQFPVYVLSGNSAGDSFGAGVAGIGDLNADGFDDFAVGAPQDAPGGTTVGSATAFSGLGAAILYHQNGTTANEQYGGTVAGGGDVNNDGFDDFAISAPWFQGIGSIQGRVEVRSGLDGSIIWAKDGVNAGSLFGESVVLKADVNNDNFDDFLVAAPNDDGTGANSGIVYVYSGMTGALLYERSGDNNFDQLGFSLAYVGDVNNDGIDDWIAGAPFVDVPATNAGHARVFSGLNGSVLHAINGAGADHNFGSSVAAAGDLNSDGFDDFAVGARRDGTGGANAGSVVIYSGQNGAVLRRYDGVPGGFFGTAMAGAGDYDGDGELDLVIGARYEGAAGTVRIYSGADGSVLGLVQGTSGPIGEDIDGGFDVNNDGRAEFIVGARTAQGGSGEATVYSITSLLGVPYCFGDGTGTTCPCGNQGGAAEGCANSTGSGATLGATGSASVSNDDIAFLSEGLLPNQPALLFAGLNQVNNGDGLPFGDGLRCAGGSVVRLGVEFPNAQGEATWGPGLAAQGGWSPGDVRRFQVWYRNPSGSPCGAGFNLSNGFEVAFIP